MTEAIYKSRREFLAGTAVALTSATLPVPTLAATTRMLDGRAAIVLYQPHDAHATAFADELGAAGFATLALSDDPVRQWRDGLGRLVSDEHCLLLGLSNWTDFTVLRGLAAEQRRFPLLERQQRKMAGTAWARQQARDLLKFADYPDLKTALSAQNGAQQARDAAPSLFCWVI